MHVGADSTPVETIVRVSAGAAVGAYALGLFTANVYLDRIGVADFAQLRARYILTGAIVLIAFAIAFVSVRLGWSHGGRWRVLTAASMVVAGVIGWFVIVSVLEKGGVEQDEGFGNTEFRQALLLEVGVLMVGLAGTWFAMRFWRARSGADPPVTATSVEINGVGRSARIPTHLAVILASAGLLIGVVLFLAEFGRHVYPRIPVPYGGGKAVCGRLVLVEGAAAELDTPQLHGKGGRMTAPVPIAYEGDTFIVIGLGGDTWLRLRKELVEALEIGPDSSGCDLGR